MSRYLFTLCCLLCISVVHAQTTTTISSGTNIVNSGATYNVPAGFFVNDGSYTDTTSPGAFNVNGGVTFSGTGTTTVYNLNFNSGLSLLNSPVTAYGTVTVGAGDSLDANNMLILHPGATLVVNGYIVNNAIGLVTNASATSGSCTSYTSNLSTNISGGSILHQWQSSPDNTTWTSVPGATAATYVATVTSTVYYRDSVSANNSPFTQTTPAIQLLFSGGAPAAITGNFIICTGGGTTTLADATTGGTWSSSAPSIASVNSTNGFVTGGATNGTAIITYSTGCAPDATQTITVNLTPSPITGTAAVCTGAITSLTETTTGGIWSSSDNSKATVDGSGNVSGILAGTATITNTAATGCAATIVVTINQAPAPISSNTNLCAGATTTLGDATGIGTWSSSTASVATIGSNSGFVTAGTVAGTSTITYTLTYGANTCLVTTNVTVSGLPGNIGGPTNVCAGSITATALTDATSGGAWSTSNTTNATVDPVTGFVSGVSAGVINVTYTTAVGCIATAPFTVNATPSPVTGTTNVCAGLTTTLADAITGGAWSSSVPATASIDINTGLVTGGANPGGTVTITYTLTGNCTSSTSFTVNAMPGTITGTNQICPGLTTAPLTEAVTGGVWSSSNTAVATTGPTGTVTGAATGTATIIYTMPGNCTATFAFTVNQAPAPITGPTAVCSGSTITLADAISGGTWGSNNPANANINSVTGVVTGGGSAGPAPIITYTLPGSGCSVSTTVTVNTLPGNILTIGGGAYCVGTVAPHAFSSSPSSPLNNYQLFNGATAVGSPVPGNGGILDYGPQAAAGTYTVAATIAATGCTANMAGSATVTVNPLPTEYAVTGSGTYCSGGTGDTVGLSNSDAGVSYQLFYNNGVTNVATGAAIPGTGTGISFVPAETAGGTYTVVATSTTGTGCTNTMSGSAVISVSTPPAAFNVTGSGSYCAGGTGVVIGLNGSEVGVNYQLLNPAPTGSPVPGTGSSISFGLQTAGTYSVTATNAATGCTAAMTGSANVISNPLPAIVTVSGGGTYCAAGTGVTVNLSATEPNVSYQLYNGPTPVGSVIIGDGTPQSFTNVTSAGTLTVLATNTITLCTNTMSGSATVTAFPLPIVHNVTGSGGYCPGTLGVHVFVDFSNIGINYQLYNGATAVGGVQPGSNAAIDFGPQLAGTYTVVAINASTACTVNMTGSAIVTVNPLPAVNTVTGGGPYCSGGVGVHIGLNGSVTGNTYQLLNGATSIGAPLPGTNSSLDFGLFTAAGTYTITAANAVTTCTVSMTGNAIVTINPLPATITGTTNVCPGTTASLTDAGGGTWTSNNTAVATVGSTGVITGVTSGSATITYTLPTTCSTSILVTVNAVPPAISGGNNVCLGTPLNLTDISGGGTWVSSNLSAATVNSTNGTVTGVAGPATTTITYTAATTGCTTSTVVSVSALTATITGTLNVCTGATTLLSNTGSGSWSSGNILVATVDPASGNVFGIIPGTAIITFTSTTGCMTSVVVTVNQTPAAITGTGSVCIGLTLALQDGTSGGTWSSSSNATASVDPTGIVTGGAQGFPVITYTMPSGCTATTTVTVNSLPQNITGTQSVCTGLPTVLATLSTGGVWSSSSTALATVVATGTAGGTVTGVAAGSLTITYTLPTGCITTALVTVNQTPAAIIGVNHICTTLSTTLSDATTGGLWSSSAAGTANVGSTTGVVTAGFSAGTANIIYTLPSTCSATFPVTVNPSPFGITGTTTVCTGFTTALSDASTGGGVWSSNNTLVATVGSTGTPVNVSGVAVGSAIITFALPTGCKTTATVVVNQTPAAISGNASVCTGFTTVLADATSGGTWSSNNNLLASVDVISGTVLGVLSNGTNPLITYTLPTGCIATVAVTVNQTPFGITGTPIVCTGVTTPLGETTTGGGVWSSSNTSFATVGPTGIVTGVGAGTPNISFTVPTGCFVFVPVTVNTSPSPISGNSNVCLGLTTTLNDAIGTGTWASNNNPVATVDPVSGVVTGVTLGSATIIYTLPSGCTKTLLVSVNTQPAIITGSPTVCTGSNTTLSDATTGGTWTSSNTTFATIVGSTGVVSGIAPGALTISYTLAAGCNSTWQLTVNPTPTPIIGSNKVCAGGGITALVDTSFGGTWSSSNTAQATVGSLTGSVTGVAAGSTTITYTLPAGCTAILPMTVNPLPGTITGSVNVCVTASITLGETTTGGIWSSSNTTQASVGSTGIVTGIAPGTPTISYTLPTGCFVADPITVNALPGLFAATGGGSYCAGGVGQHIGLNGSAIGINYQLVIGGSTLVGSPIAGTGSSLDFGLQTTGGTYTIVAINATTGCSLTMTNSISIIVNPLPTAYFVTGGGSYCSGLTGLAVGLFNSNLGIRYQLYNGTTAIGSQVSGTGAAISFGLKTLAGTYTVVATDSTSGCVNNMSGSVTISITPLPAIHNVTGGGTYCTGGTGVHIGLDGSDIGVNYQLNNGASVGSVVPGTGAAIDLGLITTAGTYTIVATNPSTTCTSNMSGNALVTISTPPSSVFAVSGSGAYCSGATGPAVTLSGSTVGVNYQLFTGATAVTGLIAGTGGVINFGTQTQTVAGTYTYTVTATTAVTGCSAPMTGSAITTVNALPAVFNVGGGGTICTSGTGKIITLSGSATGVNYSLVVGGASLGSLAGTNSALNSPAETTAGTYIVIATKTSTSCTDTMNGSATIIVNPLPTAYTVTGGGSYCSGDPGIHVGLSNSDATVSYQLYYAGTPAGAPVTGTGTTLDLGLQTPAGAYTVIGTNITTLCTSAMSNSVTVTVNALPAVYTITGGGSYCAGGSAPHVGLSNSATGVNYQLYNSGIPVGTPLPGLTLGIASPLDFGAQAGGGTYTVIATSTAVTSAGTHCSSTMSGLATITVTPLPPLNTVTGGGAFCAGGTGVHVGLNGTASGNTYQLYIGTAATGTPMTGTGSSIDFGPQLIGGTYTVVATSGGASCSATMTGSAIVTVNPLPAVFNITGGGTYCAGGSGIHVGLSGSTVGINYQLRISGTPVGTPIAGTGSTLDFGLQTVPATYRIVATNATTGCTSNMLGSVLVAISTPPTVYTIIGGGTYCSGGTGVDIGLSGSNTGVSYQLYNGGVPTGSAVAGSGGILDFGNHTGAGSYSVIATDNTSACTNNMSGSATVNINPLPVVYSLSGGGSYCPGGTGADITMSGSDAGVTYQLFTGGMSVGSAVTGTGAGIDFGLETTPGAYTAVATNTTTGCVNNMTGSATVSLYPLPNVYAVLGGGSYCAGVSGVDVSLSGSDNGVNYQLFKDGVATGGLVSGSGFAIDFGLETATGVYTVEAINATTGCTINMTGNASVAISPLPVVYNVTGGGGYCIGGTGADVTLSSSASGVNYQLYRGTSPIGSLLPGTGTALDFGLQVVAGTYTVLAINNTTSCQAAMASSATVSINPLPTANTVTGGGGYCTGGAGVHIGLNGSVPGISYQLYNDTSAAGAPLAGTGAALDFGAMTAGGAYTVVATNTATSCTSNMTGNATITVNPLPTVHTVTGSGSYCAGGTGVHIYIDGSDTGVNYQLYNGVLAAGSTVSGTGSSIDFGLQTAAGNYTVFATNATTTCTNNMADSAIITINPLPTAYTVTGGGGFCAGGVGALVSITGTATGVTYQVYHGTIPMGTAQAGTGFPLGLGFETAPGSYTVVATNTITGCTNTMTGTATVTVNPLPSLYSVTGGGSYCTGGTGTHVMLNGSGSGINYQLSDGSLTVGGLVAGTGSVLDFGAQTAAGTYTVMAINAITGCTRNMTGSAAVAIYPLPTVYTVTGGGSYCAGGTGVAVTMSHSDTGVMYQLYNGTAPTGGLVAGTGSALNLGLQTAAGVYTVVATNATTGCTQNMTGSATISVNALPSAYAVIGGGSYCAGGTGFHVGLSASNAGVTYMLFKNGGSAIDTITGTGAAIDFGLQTAAGVYTVTAANATTGCGSSMSGSTSISIYPQPTVEVVTGGGSYCAGGTGMNIILTGSDTSVNYQLFNGTTPTGSLVAGTGSTLSFGLQTLPGTYTVVATNGTTTCTAAMAGTANISIIPTVTPSVTLTPGTSDTVCAGTSVAFTALAANGGATPSYYWYVGGILASTGTSYSYEPANGDVVSVSVTSSAACAVPATATNAVTMTVMPNLTPSVTIGSTPGDTVCKGSTEFFTATGVNGGTAPVYTWRVDGVTVTGTGTTFDYIPSNGDVVFCVLASNYRCRTDTAVISNSISLTVDSATIPTVSILVHEGQVMNGYAYNDTLAAIVINGGFFTTYQWTVNGVDIPGATFPLFYSDSLFNNEVISCTATNRNACGAFPATGQTVITLSNVGVKNITSSGSDIKLVPNPNNGTFTLKGNLGTTNDEEVSVEITDMLGQVIYKDKTMAPNGTINEKIQLSNTIANGMYILNLRSGSEQTIFHMVIEQ